MLTRMLGKVTVEKEWLEKKLKSLGLSDKKQMIELKLKKLSLSHQCSLIGLNRSSHYYKSREKLKQHEIKTEITRIFEEIPIYGEVKVHQQLLEDGFKVSLNTVANYWQQLGLKAVLAVRQVKTTLPIRAHKKYSYKLPERLKTKGITISMDGKGRATDNICIERFWRSAKCERIYLNEYNSIGALEKDVTDSIDFYNNRRFHET